MAKITSYDADEEPDYITVDSSGNSEREPKERAKRSFEKSESTRLIDDSGTGTRSQEGNDIAVVAGATILGALAGAVLGGPRAGIVSGAAAGAAASLHQGPVGDAARAVGGVGVAAGQKAVELDRKHSIVEQTKEASIGLWNSVVELDRKHGIVEGVKKVAVSAYDGVIGFEKKHSIVERTSNAITHGANALATKISGDENTNDEPTNPPEALISKLMNMGFDREPVVSALRRSNNNLDRAANLLLE